jgi:hypothetical protein
MPKAAADSNVLQFAYGPSLGSRLASMWVYWLLSVPCIFAGGFMLRATLTDPSGPDGTFVACGAPFVLVPPLLFLFQIVKHLRATKIRINGTEIVKVDGGTTLPLGDVAGAEAVWMERSLIHEEWVRQPTASEAHLQTNRVTKMSTSEVIEVVIGDVVVTRLVNDFRLAQKRAQACARHLGLPVVGPGDRFAPGRPPVHPDPQ